MLSQGDLSHFPIAWDPKDQQGHDADGKPLTGDRKQHLRWGSTSARRTSHPFPHPPSIPPHHTARRSRISAFPASSPCGLTMEPSCGPWNLRRCWQGASETGFAFLMKKTDKWPLSIFLHPAFYKVKSLCLEPSCDQEEPSRKMKEGHKVGGGDGQRVAWMVSWISRTQVGDFLPPDFPYKEKCILFVQATGFWLLTVLRHPKLPRTWYLKRWQVTDPKCGIGRMKRWSAKQKRLHYPGLKRWWAL